MPIDKWGTRVDLIMDGVSVTKRLNLGQLYVHYITASADMISRKLREMDTTASIEEQWDYLVGWYKIASPLMYERLIHILDTRERIENHLRTVKNSPIVIQLPPNSPNIGPGQVSALRDGLEKNYPLEYGPLTYGSVKGGYVVTKDPMIVGSKYMMLLEATPDKWSAVATSKLQHFGIPALLTNKDKHSLPVREQPVRLLGEDEVRLFLATIGPEATAELIDQSNNPLSHKSILRTIMRSDTPTNIDSVVDREAVPRGNSRPLAFVKHTLSCSGIRLKYKEYEHEAD
jgi:hypothetical protein